MPGLPIGKLPAKLLAEMLNRYASHDPRVIVGPRVGEDAAVIDMGARYLVAKSDPITFATDEIGWYAVNVNANDIACCGAIPRWYLATLLLPENKTTAELVDSIFAQLAEACRQLEVTLCGGHTEITYGLDRPIVVGQMLGEVAPQAYVRTAGAQVDDSLILTKGIAIEGCAIIAREKQDELKRIFRPDEINRIANLLHDPGISVVPDAQTALEVGGVHALHDPTEGGLATGLRELAEAAGVGLLIDEFNLPILPECETICCHFNLDPLGLIASGSLLISAASGQATRIVSRLRKQGIAAKVIGRVVASRHGCRLHSRGDQHRPLPEFDRDEISRLFE